MRLCCAVLTVGGGVILAFAFSAILVSAHELVPSRVGLVSASGSVARSAWAASARPPADDSGRPFVFHRCAFLLLLGLLTGFLPDVGPRTAR